MTSEEKIFFIVGAQRCGTSFLAQLLDAHPEIKMAKPFFPEPKFFSNESEFVKGRKYYLDKYFGQNYSSKILGEKSTSYFESEETAKRIKAMFHDSKIIISLRNPIDRAISHYNFSVGNGVERRSLKEAIANPIQTFDQKKFSVSPYDYLGRGEYLKFLLKYMEVFGSNKIHVLIFEDFMKDAILRKNLFNFLDVDVNPNFMKDEIINASKSKELVASSIYDSLKTYYITHNKKLSEYLQVDLSSWDKY
jgi:hypothetical protein